MRVVDRFQFVDDAVELVGRTIINVNEEGSEYLWLRFSDDTLCRLIGSSSYGDWLIEVSPPCEVTPRNMRDLGLIDEVQYQDMERIREDKRKTQSREWTEQRDRQEYERLKRKFEGT